MKWLDKLLRFIGWTRPSRRPQLIEQALVRIDREIEHREQEDSRLKAEEPELAEHPGHEPGADLQRRSLRRLGWWLSGLDVPLQILVNAFSFVGIPFWWWVPGGFVIAGALTGVSYSAGTSFFHDPDRPGLAVLRARRTAAAAGALTALAGVVILLARFAGLTLATFLEPVLVPSLFVVAEGLPLTAGLVLTTAKLLSYPDDHARRRGMIHEELVALRNARVKLAIEYKNLTGREPPEAPPAASPPRRPAPSPSGAPAAATTVALLAVLGIVPAEAQRTCQVWTDGTVSVDSVARFQALQAIADNLQAITDRLGCSELMIVPFSDAPRWSPRRLLQVPAQMPSTSCDDVTLPAYEGPIKLRRVFRSFLELDLQNARAACAATQASAKGLSDAQWTAFTRDVRSALSSPPPVPERNDTPLVELVQYLVCTSRTSVAMIITDGLESREPAVPDVQLPAGMTLVLILVPARQAWGGGTAALEAAREWTARVKGLRVMTYEELASPGRLESLGTTPGAKGTAGYSGAAPTVLGRGCAGL